MDSLMYEGFYGLRERPFDLTPNPRYLFLTAKHREALSALQYGISRRNGVTLLIGEAGTGKTTLVHAALEQQRGHDALSVYLSNPALTRSEFFEFLALGFGVGREAAASKTRFVLDLTCLLVDRWNSGTVSALIVDEAQCLPDELLEEVRLLANIESATDKLLSIILAGQPEVADRLNQPSLRQLKQRVSLRCGLSALERNETAAYIATRIQVAGGDCKKIFTQDAVEAIHQWSRGIPRTISVICDNALISGFAIQQRLIGTGIVLEVCRDLDLGTGARSAPAAGFFGEAHVLTASTPPLPARSAMAAEEPVTRDGLFEHFSRSSKSSFLRRGDA